MNRIALAGFALGEFIAFGPGCTAHTERAVRASNRISEIAASSQRRFERIEAHIQASPIDARAIVEDAIAGQEEQAEIQRAASSVREEIANTRDNPSPWAEALRLWGLVFLVSLVMLAFVYLGIAPLLRRLLR
jgi:hypothetical protein